MDISETLAPSSDQLDAVDLLGGPRTFTITGVKRGSDEQPVQIVLADFPRVWRPGKSMRRVLAAAWGVDASKYAGRKVTLYCDPDVMFGRDKTGGTRISAMSHIDKPLTVPLIIKRGVIKPFTVQPLADAPAPTAKPTPKAAQKPAPDTTDDVFADMDALTRFLGSVESATTAEELRALWNRIPELLPEEQYADAKQAINARSEELPASKKPAGEAA